MEQWCWGDAGRELPGDGSLLINSSCREPLLACEEQLDRLSEEILSVRSSDGVFDELADAFTGFFFGCRADVPFQPSLMT